MADLVPIPLALFDRLARAVDVDRILGRAKLPRSRFRVAKPQVDGHLPFSTKQMDYVRQALTGVVQGNGTAVQAFTGFPLSRIPVAANRGDLLPFSGGRSPRFAPTGTDSRRFG